MRRLTRQQVKVFGMFAAAFVLSALAFAFHDRGDVSIALATTFTAFALICAMILEAQDS